MQRPKILITNDDGISADGLRHLWLALKKEADLYIIAPSSQKSGVGLGLTLHKPITINPAAWKGQDFVWKISGTPADCVRLGLRLVLKHKPDLVVSGINQGSNAGRNVLYSGTVGGVTEGALRGIPGIAFSSVEFNNPRYADIVPHIYPIVKHTLEHPLTPGTILNVNFPTKFDKFKGIRMAQQGKGLWVEEPDQRIHPNGEHYYWHGGTWSHHEEHEDSDVMLLSKGYITAVPIHVDQMTDFRFLKSRKKNFEYSLNPEQR